VKVNSLAFWLLAVSILIFSCTKDEVHEGMKPIYYSYDDFSGIKSGQPIPFSNLGKIISKGSLLLINEKNKGIHVIDNTNPENAIQKYFWNIPGNTEFTLIQNTLYADNGKHLIVIDVSNPEILLVLTIIKNQYTPERIEVFPQNYKGYFECFDSNKGILSGWEMDNNLINPYCKTN
jgi:hypothetical protein